MSAPEGEPKEPQPAAAQPESAETHALPSSRADSPTVAVVTPVSPTSPRSPVSPTGRPAPRSASTFVDGQVISARYRVIRFIAQGGMGEVYEAEDCDLGGRVALKTIRPEIAQDHNAIERFKREINLSRRISHPNVCRIHDLGRHAPPAETGESEILFLTMELLAGETLAARVKRGPMPVSEALPIVQQIASALETAHQQGIIHRDLKSNNVMLAPATPPAVGVRAVVTDFGLARGFLPTSSIASISDGSAIIGTPAYMAPEQVQGIPLTPAADIYALGVILYEMVSGLRPFDGGSALSIAVRRLTEEPRPLREVVPDLDPVWEAVILRCLERSPEARFASASGVAAALGAQVDTAVRSPLAPPTAGSAAVSVRPEAKPAATASLAPKWRKRLLSGALAAVVLGLASAATYWALRRAPGGTEPAPARTAATGAPRRTVAILGLKNTSGQPESSWLSTAIVEMLLTDFAEGGRVRVVPGAEVAVLKRDLGFSEADSLSKDVIERIRQSVGADLVVLGSYTRLGKKDDDLLRVDLRLQDTTGAGIVASGSATGTESQLFDLVARAERPLRDKVGLGELSPAAAIRMESTLPGNRAAARLYAEGLDKLRLLDARSAKDSLEKAVAAEPTHPLPHAALADALSALGYSAKALEEATLALSYATRLNDYEKLALEARRDEIAKEWEKAIGSYRALTTQFPDDLEYGLRLLDALINAGQTKEALVAVDRLRQLPAPLSDDPRIDLAQARTYQTIHDYSQQQTLAGRAASKGSDQGRRLVLARARLVEATALDALGRRDPALAALEEARKLFENAGDRGGTARALGLIAALLHDSGDLSGAKRITEKSLGIYREIGDAKGQAEMAHNLAIILFRQGDYTPAERLYAECLATFKRIGARFEAASTLNDFGVMLLDRGDLHGAKVRYQQALAVFGEIGEKSGVSMTLGNLAEVLYLEGNVNQAYDTHNESLAVNREIGDKSGEAYDLFSLGEILTARGDYRVAREKFDEALVIQKQVGERIAAATTRLALADLTLAEKQAGAAESLAREAEETLRVEGAADVAARAQVTIAQSLLAQGKLEEAQKQFGEARPRLAESSNRRLANAAVALDARLRVASGKAAEITAGIQALSGVAAKANKAGFVADAFELRLALGEVEIAAGRTAAGRARLKVLAAEAQTKGFRAIAQKAAALS